MYDFEITYIQKKSWSQNDLLTILRNLWEVDKHGIEFRWYNPGREKQSVSFEEIIQYIEKDNEGSIELLIKNENNNEYRTIKCYTLGLSRSLSMGFLTLSGEGYHDIFWNFGDPNGYNESKMLKIMKKTYDGIHPFHAYLEEGEFPYNYIVTANHPWTGKYWSMLEFYLNKINFFGPEIVNRIGRERLWGIDAHIIEDLGDGGMMIVPNALNQEMLAGKNHREGKFKLPLDDETVQWYSKITGWQKKKPPE